MTSAGGALEWSSPSRASAPNRHDIYIICSICHSLPVSWIVEISDEFEPEFDELHEDVRTELLALTPLLQHFGPQLGGLAWTS